MSDAMTITHSGVVITYDEPTNRFKFELRGRQRSAESLAKAKEAIDKPVNEKEEKPFKPVECWKLQFGEWTKGRATSVAENPSWSSGGHVWFVNAKGERSRQDADLCYPVGKDNDAAVERWTALQAEIDRLAKTQEQTVKSMESLKID